MLIFLCKETFTTKFVLFKEIFFYLCAQYY